MNQRRCIHDAFGNEDPVKVAEQAIPRPHARKNHKAIESQAMPGLPADEPRRPQEQPKRMAPIANMMAPVANMIAAPQPSAQQYPASAQKARDRDISSVEPMVVVSKVAVDNVSTLAQTSEDRNTTMPELTKIQPDGRREEKHEEPAIDEGAAAESATAIASEQLPPSSSLISPPASSNDDVGSSPINGVVTYSPSPPPSKQLLHQAPKELHQRYTPESGTLRRASSSSFEQQRNDNGQDKVDEMSPAALRHDLGVSPHILADSESLRLV